MFDMALGILVEIISSHQVSLSRKLSGAALPAIIRSKRQAVKTFLIISQHIVLNGSNNIVVLNASCFFRRKSAR
jgi:hypothetical protein